MLKYITRGNTSPDGKIKIYFSCISNDFGMYFKPIVNEILSRLNCVIFYYTGEDEISLGERTTDISQMQLMVIPVTAKLLLSENDTIAIDFPIAKKLKMPILPLMQEGGLEKLYKEKFGDLQFLDKTNLDTTAISYDDKLTNFLSSLFLNETLIKQIKHSFDAYIFLSYRKKDREYANKLMRLIHNDDFCRNIAIWYDEYLIPGENFNSSIKHAIETSNLFVLTVTPNIIEEGNYVLREEYPFAKTINKVILPIEMIETNRNLLSENYSGIGRPISANNNIAINEAILQLISNSARTGNDSPEHDFFIGLAYLNGIDVEINREYAFYYINSAAESNLPEAISKLVDFYHRGICVDKNLEYAIIWQRKLIIQLKNISNGDLKDIIKAYWDLSEIYEERRDSIVLITFYNEFLDIFKEVVGDEYLWDSLRIKIKLAFHYSRIDDKANQKQAFTIYNYILNCIVSIYSAPLDNSKLELLSNFIEDCALFLITKSRRFDDNIDTKDLIINIKKLRKLIERNNKISYEKVFDDSVFHKANITTMQQWYSNICSGIDDKIKEAIMFDAESDFTSTNPLINAEELLFLSLGILEYLGRIDMEKYGLSYSRILGHIAQLHLDLGYIDRAIETVKLNIACLEKFQSDFYLNLTKQLVDQYNLISETYLKQDPSKSEQYLSMAATLLASKVKENPQYLYDLALIYYNASNFYVDNERIEVLLNSKDIMEKFVKTEFFFPQAEMKLVAIYYQLCKNYTQPSTWDNIEVHNYFVKAIKLCEKYYENNKMECSYLLCKLHNVRIFLEDCKTKASRENVIRLFSIAFNNCEILLNADSEYAYPAYNETISHLKSFYHYIENYFVGDSLLRWYNDLSQVIAMRLNHIEEIEPIHLVPHNFRVHFSDYDLINGNVDFSFINNFKSILYLLLEIFINKVYKIDMLDKSFDLKHHIEKLYNEIIDNGQQGYAKQIFSLERKQLLSMF